MKNSPKIRGGLLVALTSTLFVTSAALRAAETDDGVDLAFKNSYVFRRFLANDAIRAESKDGQVTLTGTVKNQFHAALADYTVECLPGVKRVDNRLVVRDEPPIEYSDAWLKLKVGTALMFHRGVSVAKVDIIVKDSNVSLGGTATSSAQKDLITACAKDVSGVKAVNNEMTIDTTNPQPDDTMRQKIDDASITAQVKMSLLAHRSTSALRTKVKTSEGVVTLAGVAKNATERDLVTKLATDVIGVTSVINNMSLEVAMSMGQPRSRPAPPQHFRIVSQ